jgi:hypothetical protein
MLQPLMHGTAERFTIGKMWRQRRCAFHYLPKSAVARDVVFSYGDSLSERASAARPGLFV